MSKEFDAMAEMNGLEMIRVTLIRYDRAAALMRDILADSDHTNLDSKESKAARSELAWAIEQAFRVKSLCFEAAAQAERNKRDRDEDLKAKEAKEAGKAYGR